MLRAKSIWFSVCVHFISKMHVFNFSSKFHRAVATVEVGPGGRPPPSRPRPGRRSARTSQRLSRFCSVFFLQVFRRWELQPRRGAGLFWMSNVECRVWSEKRLEPCQKSLQRLSDIAQNALLTSEKIPPNLPKTIADVRQNFSKF